MSEKKEKKKKQDAKILNEKLKALIEPLAKNSWDEGFHDGLNIGIKITAETCIGIGVFPFSNDELEDYIKNTVNLKFKEFMDSKNDESKV